MADEIVIYLTQPDQTVTVTVAEGPAGPNEITSSTTSDGTAAVYLDTLRFNTSDGPPTQSGEVSWNSATGTLDVMLENGVIAPISESGLIHVRNTSGTTIPKGAALAYIGTAGASGRLEVANWETTNVTVARSFLGFASGEIANNSNGYAVWFGKLSGIDTDGSSQGETWADGEVIYASPGSPATLTNVAPTTGEWAVAAAIINAGSGTSGSLFIRPSFDQESGNPFDQSLNTTDDVRFDALDLTGGAEFGSLNAYGEFSPYGGIGTGLFTGGSSGLHVRSNGEALNLGAGSEFVSIDASGNLSGTHLQNVGTSDSPTFAALSLPLNAQLNSGSETYGGIFLGDNRNGPAFYTRWGNAASVSFSVGRYSAGNTWVAMNSTAVIGWGTGTDLLNGQPALGLVLARDDNNTLAQKNGTNPQEFRVYGTTADNSRLSLSCDTSGDATIDVASDSGSGTGYLTIDATRIETTCRIEPEIDGSSSYHQLGSSSRRWWKIYTKNITTNGLDLSITAPSVTASGTVKTGSYLTEDLPAAATAGAGARAFVTDSDTAASGNFGSLFSGGGSNAVPVWSDGSNWFIG